MNPAGTVPRVLVTRTGLCPVMVGRAEELTLLRDLLGAPGHADQGPTVVTISGEAGVGKSRLVRELLLQVPDDWVVLAGQAEEGDLARPFELLRDAVEPHVASWDAPPAELADRGHPVGHLLTGLLSSPHQHEHGHEHPLDEIVRAGVELVRHLTGGRKAVVVFEDLHWADAESVQLFGRLATRQDLPIVLIGTVRLEDIDRRHPVAGLFAELQRTVSLTSVELGRLSRRELGDMLRIIFSKPVSERAIDALHSRTQGNAFFVEELLDTCGCVEPEDLATAPLPWNVAEAVLRRVDTLDAETRSVLDAAAVLGTRVPFDLLAAVSGVGEDRLIQALRTLVEARILAEHESDVFTFRHALTRDAVASALLGREQRRLHERALEELRAAGSDDTAALARHAAGARRFDEVVDLARRGAARYLRDASPLQALNLAELGLAEAPDDVGLRSTAAQASWALGMVEESERHGEAWRRLAIKDGDVAQESAALRLLAFAARHRGDRLRYRSLVDQALERAETLGPSPELAWALAYQSQAAMVLVEPDAERWARRALDMIDQVGSEEIRPFVLVNLGTSILDQQDREDEGLAILQQAWKLAEQRSDGLAQARAISNMLNTWFDREGPDGALPLLQALDATIDRYGLEVMRSLAHTFRVHHAGLAGDLDRAWRHYDLGRRLEDHDERVFQCVNGGRLALERGDQAGAEEAVAAAEALLPVDAEGPMRAWADLLQVAVAAGQDDPARMREALASLRHSSSQPTVVCTDNGEREGTAVLDALRGGHPVAEVRAFFEEALPPARRLQERRRAWALHAEAALLEAEGDLEGAVRTYRQAVEAERPARWAIWRSDAHLGLARCLLATGEPEAAAVEARRAVALLAAWPGVRRERAEALARRLSTAHDTGTSPSGLTARELEVLALVAEGLTNRQIADRLFISVKTAAVHVSNILGKTGASSRTEAAAWALQTGVLA